MGMNMERRKEEITEEVLKNRLIPIFQREGLRLVILFGSAASGKIHKKSDIDSVLFFNNELIGNC